MNFNDAEITGLFVSQTASPTVEDDAPNAPGGGTYDVTLEMVAGNALDTQEYTLVMSCSDITATAAAPATVVPGAPLNGAGKFGDASWIQTAPGGYFTYAQTATVGPEPAAGKGHVYRYTAVLFNPNGQVVSIKSSDDFVLV
jgi:hypothetical protein